MDRAAERRQLKLMKKKVKDLTVEEFKAIIDGSAGDAFERGYEEGFNLAVRILVNVLRKVFGFGDKRIDRLMRAIDEDTEVTNGDTDINRIDGAGDSGNDLEN